MKKIWFLAAVLILLCGFEAYAEESTFSAEIAEWEAGLPQIVSGGKSVSESGQDTDTDVTLACSFGAAVVKKTDYSKLYIMNDSLVDYNDCYVGMNIRAKIPDGGTTADGIVLSRAPDSENGIEWFDFRNSFPGAAETFRYLSGMKKLYHSVYTLDEQKNITGILIEKKDISEEQWKELLKTAEELYYTGKKKTGLLQEGEACLQGTEIIGKPVDELIAILGEPADVQTLPGGTGRILIYSTIVVSLCFDEKTGQELVSEITVFGPEYSGPRSVCVGCTSEEFQKVFTAADAVQEDGGFSMENDTVQFSCCFCDGALKCWRLRMKEGEN